MTSDRTGVLAGSRVYQLIERLRSAVDRPSVGRTVGGAWLVARSWSLLSAGRRASRRSTLVGTLRRGTALGSAAVAGSRLSRTLATLLTIARASWLYRRFVVGSPPSLVVFDPREVTTVRPFLVPLDWLFDRGRTAAAASRLIDVVDRSRTALRAAPVRAAGVCGLVLVLASLAVLGVFGALSPTVVAAHLVLAVLAGLATRVERSWEEVRGSWVVQSLAGDGAVERAKDPPER